MSQRGHRPAAVILRGLWMCWKGPHGDTEKLSAKARAATKESKADQREVKAEMLGPRAWHIAGAQVCRTSIHASLLLAGVSFGISFIKAGRHPRASLRARLRTQEGLVGRRQGWKQHAVTIWLRVRGACRCQP